MGRSNPGLAVAVTAVTMMTAACGSAGEPSVEAVAPSSSAPGQRWTLDGPGRRLDSQAATHALIEPKDVGDGWKDVASEQSGLDLSRLTNIAPQGCAGWFSDYVSNRKAPASELFAGTVLRRAADAEHSQIYLTYSVRSYSTPDEAATTLAFHRTGLTSCSAFTAKMDGNEVNGSIKPVEFSRPGDDSLANRITLRESTDRGTVVHIREVLRMQVGHNVVVSLMDSDDPVPDAMMRSVLDAGFRKLDR